MRAHQESTTAITEEHMVAQITFEMNPEKISLDLLQDPEWFAQQEEL